MFALKRCALVPCLPHLHLV